MSLHKLTAGSGYTYLTRQVAAHDRVSGDRSSLASYYSEKGETPGRWVGSGMAGIDGLDVGDEVTAQHMRALFGTGLHPLAERRRERLEGPELTDRDFRAVTRLGVPFKVYTAEASTFQVQVARRIEDHNAALGHPHDYPVEPDARARIRTEVAAELRERQIGFRACPVRALSPGPVAGSQVPSLAHLDTVDVGSPLRARSPCPRTKPLSAGLKRGRGREEPDGASLSAA